MDDLDRQLISRLRTEGRAPVASLAKELGVSRGTIQNRMARLEKAGIVVGYTVRLRPQLDDQRIRGLMMVAVEGNQAGEVLKTLRGDPAIGQLHTTNGRWDLIAELRADLLARRVGRDHPLRGRGIKLHHPEAVALLELPPEVGAHPAPGDEADRVVALAARRRRMDQRPEHLARVEDHRRPVAPGLGEEARGVEALRQREPRPALERRTDACQYARRMMQRNRAVHRVLRGDGAGRGRTERREREAVTGDPRGPQAPRFARPQEDQREVARPRRVEEIGRAHV